MEVVDVDQVLGIREPQLHHREQAVPAGDDRASEPSRWSASMAPSTLVARSYSNEAGVCTSSPVTVDLRCRWSRRPRRRTRGRCRCRWPVVRTGRLAERLAAELRSSASISRGASDPPSSAGTMPSAAVSAHGPCRDLRVARVVPPRCSLGGYCTGASVPMTGDRQLLGPDWRVSGRGARVEAAALHVPEHRAVGARGGDRRLAPEPGERERALRVHLGDPRRP